MNTELTPPQPIGFVRFYGSNLLIVRHQGVEYTEAKPVSDLCGLFWKSTKRTISTEENAELYATTALLPPEIGTPEGINAPSNRDLQTTSGPQTRLYVRFDRIYMFMARINTAHVRAKGKPATADFLLTLQLEWAKALHAYEKHGIAVKPGRAQALRELHHMIRSRERLRDPGERAAFTALIHEELAAMGLPADSVDDKQRALSLSTVSA